MALDLWNDALGSHFATGTAGSYIQWGLFGVLSGGFRTGSQEGTWNLTVIQHHSKNSIKIYKDLSDLLTCHEALIRYLSTTQIATTILRQPVKLIWIPASSVGFAYICTDESSDCSSFIWGILCTYLHPLRKKTIYYFSAEMMRCWSNWGSCP